MTKQLDIIDMDDETIVGKCEPPIVPDFDIRWLDETCVAYTDFRRRLRVLYSVRQEADGKRWLHISVSHRDRLPQWKELVYVKTLFIGADATAYQVIPPAAKHINIHPNVLHIWCCLDGAPLPDFTRGNEEI